MADQAEDFDFIPETAPEAHLQQGLKDAYAEIKRLREVLISVEDRSRVHNGCGTCVRNARQIHATVGPRR